MTEFIVTPTENWLRAAGICCRNRLIISSPYVRSWLPRFLKSVPAEISKVLLTRADLRDFASGAFDLDSVCEVADHGTQIMVSNRLHYQTLIHGVPLAKVFSII